LEYILYKVFMAQELPEEGMQAVFVTIYDFTKCSLITGGKLGEKFSISKFFRIIVQNVTIHSVLKEMSL